MVWHVIESGDCGGAGPPKDSAGMRARLTIHTGNIAGTGNIPHTAATLVISYSHLFTGIV